MPLCGALASRGQRVIRWSYEVYKCPLRKEMRDGVRVKHWVIGLPPPPLLKINKLNKVNFISVSTS